MARTQAQTPAKQRQQADPQPVIVSTAGGGDDTLVVDEAASTKLGLSLDDPESCYRVVTHKPGCPQAVSSDDNRNPMDANREGGDGWLVRMEMYPATVPAANGYPPMDVVIVRCQDCGAQVRIDNE